MSDQEAPVENRPKPLHTIYVKNLDPEVRTKELEDAFDKFGKLLRCDVPQPRENQEPYGFVEFELSEDANKALEEMNGVELMGKKLELYWAKNRRGHPSSRGRFSTRGRGYGRGGNSRGGYERGRGRPYPPRRDSS